MATALLDDKIQHSSEVYHDIRRKLISAHFMPGEKLKPELLRAHYHCAASTIREVLFRLSCDGLVDAQENKGFKVPQMSKDMCNEAMQMRCLLECEGARLSILNSDVGWEAQFTAAHHKLAHVEAQFAHMHKDKGLFDLWCACEWEFHETLVSKCGSELMRRQHKDIYDLHRLHMLAILDSVEDTGFREGNIYEHQAILEAALDKDIAACQTHIRAHLKLVT